MASTIRIKRSGVTGSPATLAQGEFAYSFLDGTLTNGGDRLYLGTGTEINGAAGNIEAIGGRYFTAKLDHTPGIVTANSAIIVDTNKSIDELFFGTNLGIDLNSIKTAAGNLTIDPFGDLIINGDTTINGSLNLIGNVDLTGDTNVDFLFVSSLTTDRVTFVGANNEIIDSANLTFDGSILSVFGQFNADNIRLDGNTISATNLNGDIILSPNGTGVVDVSSSIIFGVSDPTGPSNAVNLQFLDNAEYTLAGDSGSASILITSGTVTVAGGTGLTSTTTGAAGSGTVAISLDNTSVVAGSYGSNVKIPTFTVDAQGRLTAAGEQDVATNLGLAGDTGTGNVNLLTDVLSITGGVGVDTSATGTSITIAIGQDVSTSSNVQFADGSFSGNLVIDGDFTVNGNTTIVSTQTLEVEDSLIKLATGNVTDTISIGFYGQYGTTSLKSGFFRSHEDGGFYLFQDLAANITDTNVISIAGLQLADFNAKDIIAANINLSGDIDANGTVTANLFVGEIDGGTY